MSEIGLTKSTIPAVSTYNGNLHFSASAGDTIKVEQDGVEHVKFTIPAGESWELWFDIHVAVN